jgi:hypothetical protein
MDLLVSDKYGTISGTSSSRRRGISQGVRCVADWSGFDDGADTSLEVRLGGRSLSLRAVSGEQTMVLHPAVLAALVNCAEGVVVFFSDMILVSRRISFVYCSVSVGMAYCG